jgi:hypothetical protein
MTEFTPPDYERCQCMITPAHGPFRLGPPEKPQQCTATPAWLAVELKPGADGLCGAMSLCNDCAKQMMEDADLRARVQLQPIFREKAV